MNKWIIAAGILLFAFSCTGMNVNLKKFDERDAEIVDLPLDIKGVLSTRLDLTPYCKGREILRVRFITESATRVWCAKGPATMPTENPLKWENVR